MPELMIWDSPEMLIRLLFNFVFRLLQLCLVARFSINRLQLSTKAALKMYFSFILGSLHLPFLTLLKMLPLSPNTWISAPASWILRSTLL